MRKRLLSLFFAGFVLLVTACVQTPDLGPWAVQTGHLQSAVANEHAEISAKLAELSMTAGALDGSNQEAAFTEKRKNFDRASSKIDGTLEVLTVYSSAIVTLAKAGETGAESVERIAATLRKATNVATPSGGMIFDTFKMLAATYTSAQAQKSLATAMTAAQPAIDTIANELRRSYQKDGTIYSINLGLSATEKGQLLSKTVPGLLEKYRNVLEFCNQNSDGEDCDTDEVTKLKPLFDSHVEALNTLVAWEQTRIDRSQAIVRAVDAWKEEHARVAVFLKKCGGFQFAPRCGDIDFSRLVALINIAKGE